MFPSFNFNACFKHNDYVFYVRASDQKINRFSDFSLKKTIVIICY